MKKISLIIAAVFLWLGGTSVQAAALNIVSPAEVVIPGQTFTLNLGLDTGTSHVVGLDAQLNYDPSLVDLVSVATISASLPTVAGPVTTIDGAKYSLLAFDGTQVTPAILGNWDAAQSPLAQTTFKAKKVGKFVAKLVFTPANTTDSNVVSLDTGNPVDVLTQIGSPVTVAIAPCIMTDDFNYDGKIDVVDLMQIAVKWGGTDPKYDLNGDQKTDIVDLMLEAGKWGTTCVV